MIFQKGNAFFLQTAAAVFGVDLLKVVDKLSDLL